jgi:prolyl-tRNA synthetase
MVKTVLFKAVHKDREVLWAALIRGDQQINEVKLRNQTGGLALVMLTDEEIRKHTGAEHGFAGPVGLPSTIKVISDESCRGMRNVLCGVNQTDRHALDVNSGRDFPEPLYADIRLAREGEPGPVNGEPLVQRRGIEAGHIFKLGSKYSAAMEATFLDEQGKSRPLVMGCYGIGISRLAASAVEQFADDRGIVWPVAIAPYEVVVAALDKGDDAQRVAQETHKLLLGAGIDAMIDERKLSAGARFNDFELLGFPYAVVVGKSWKQDGKLEVRTRATGTVEVLTPSDAVKSLGERIARARLGI